MLKIRLLVLTFFVSQALFSKYREDFNKFKYLYLQQSDSVYKVNKVKNRTTYFKGYNEFSIKNKFEFNQLGNVVSISYPTETIWALKTEFNYDSLGKLEKIRDVYTKSSDSKYYKNFINGDKESEAKFESTPNYKVIDYQLIYTSNVISKIFRKDEKGLLVSESQFTNEGLSQSFIDKSQYPLNFKCEFLKNNQYLFLPKTFEYYGNKEIKLDKIEYIYDSDQKYIVKMIRSSYSIYNNNPKDYDEPSFIDEFLLEYNEKGLLTKVSRGATVYEYHYEYY